MIQLHNTLSSAICTIQSSFKPYIVNGYMKFMFLLNNDEMVYVNAYNDFIDVL